MLRYDFRIMRLNLQYSIIMKKVLLSSVFFFIKENKEKRKLKK